MANIFDKFLDSMKLYDDDEEEDTELEGTDYEEEEEQPKPVNKKARKQEYYEEEPAAEEPKSSRFGQKKSSPQPVHSTYAKSASMEVSMVKPSSMEDAREICDMLLAGRAVVINMEGVQVDLAQRIIDFSSGACYSIDGNLQKISSYIFIITPSDIELTGDFQGMLGTGFVPGER